MAQGAGDQYVQNLLQGVVSGAQQPTAQLNETNAAAGAAGASAGLSSQETYNATQQQELNQAKLDQLKIVNSAGTYFAKHTDTNGYINPQDYNTYLSDYVQKGGSANDFENTFGDRYINPKNVFYDTPDAKQARSALPVIKNVIDSYHNLNAPGPMSQTLSELPFLGKYLQQGPLAPEETHNAFLAGQIGNIRQIAGAGQGSGFKYNLSALNAIQGLLPNGWDSKEVANSKLSHLDSFMQDNMGISLKQLYGKK